MCQEKHRGAWLFNPLEIAQIKIGSYIPMLTPALIHCKDQTFNPNSSFAPDRRQSQRENFLQIHYAKGSDRETRPTTHMAAMASPFPMAPTPSIVVALMLTREGLMSNSLATLASMAWQ